MPSTLQQKLYLGGLAPGLNLTVTEVKLSDPGDAKWQEYFHRHGGNVIKFPFTVSTSTGHGDDLIGNLMFAGYNGVWSSGIGGQANITVRIQGTTDVNGKSYRVDQKGYITVSTTAWKGFTRPDYTSVSYQWGDTAPVNKTLSVPSTIAGQPDDLYFVFAVSADGKQIGVNTTLNKDVINETLDYALKGIFWVNEKLVGWAIGKAF